MIELEQIANGTLKVKSKDRFDDSVKNILVSSDWYPNRSVPNLVSEWKSMLIDSDNWIMFPKAEEVLTEFGGLKITPPKHGINYDPEAFIINPSGIAGEKDRFDIYESKIGSRLFPLGEIESGMAFLAIDDEGKVYHIMTFIKLKGISFDEALKNSILGISYGEMIS